MLPVLLVFGAFVADTNGAHALALDALLAAVPFAAVAALACFGDYLDGRDDAAVALQALLSTLAVALLVLSCAVRSDATGNAATGVPALAHSAVVACLGIFAIKAALSIGPYARRLADLRPAKP